MSRAADLRQRFLAAHHEPPATPTPGVLVMPNAFDVGSARLFVDAGAAAVATTSSGFAATLGRPDGATTRDEMVEHARLLAASIDVPLSVDSEDGYGATHADVAATARALAATDAAGCSIEDWDREVGRIRPLDDAVARVAAARAGGEDLVLTARSENHLHGVDDLDDTIRRLRAYREAGADVVYAPGVVDAGAIRRLADEVDAPLNVLALPSAPSIPELAESGVARVSVGGLAAWVAYGAVRRMAEELFGAGTSGYAVGVLAPDVRRRVLRTD